MQKKKIWGKFNFVKKKRCYFRPFFCFLSPAFGHGRLGHPQSLEYYVFCFLPTSGKLTRLKICIPQYFDITMQTKTKNLRTKNRFSGVFSSFYGQRSVTAAWATPSPGVLILQNSQIIGVKRRGGQKPSLLAACILEGLKYYTPLPFSIIDNLAIHLVYRLATGSKPCVFVCDRCTDRNYYEKNTRLQPRFN